MSLSLREQGKYLYISIFLKSFGVDTQILPPGLCHLFPGSKDVKIERDTAGSEYILQLKCWKRTGWVKKLQSF